MDKKGLWIPKDILDDEQLDWINKVLLSEIYSLDKLEKGCFASNNYFGDFLGIDKSAASKRITKLRKLGYISCRNIPKGNEIDHRVITKSNRHLNKGGPIKDEGVVPRKQGGSSQKTRGVLPTEQRGSSTGNTINTTTNTDLKKQLEIHNTGTSILEKNVERKSDLSFFFEEAKMEATQFLTGATILGEEILLYSSPEKHDDLVKCIGNIKFDLIADQLDKFNYANQQLNKLKSSSTQGLIEEEPT